MTEPYEVLVTRAQSHAGLSALISYGSGLYAFYPLVLPRNANIPAVVYQTIDTPRIRTHDSGPAALAAPRFQLASWGKTYTQAKSVAKQVRLAFDGWVDKSAGLRVDVGSAENEIDDLDDITGLWRVISDVILRLEDNTS